MPPLLIPQPLVLDIQTFIQLWDYREPLIDQDKVSHSNWKRRTPNRNSVFRELFSYLSLCVKLRSEKWIAISDPSKRKGREF